MPAEPPAIPLHRPRTGPAADLEALADTLVRVSHLAMHIEGHLAELDINPLMVLPSGQGVKAVDALVGASRHIALHAVESDRHEPVPGHTHAKSVFIAIA